MSAETKELKIVTPEDIQKAEQLKTEANEYFKGKQEYFNKTF